MYLALSLITLHFVAKFCKNSTRITKFCRIIHDGKASLNKIVCKYTQLCAFCEIMVHLNTDTRVMSERAMCLTARLERVVPTRLLVRVCAHTYTHTHASA